MKFVNKQLSIKLKEKGFDKPCFGWYNIENNEDKLILNVHEGTISYKNLLEYTNDIKTIADAPTIEQTLEWLREEKNIHIGIIPCFMMSPKNNIMWLWEILLVGKIIECKNTIYADKDYNYTELASVNYYANYENACIAGIEFVINNLI